MNKKNMIFLAFVLIFGLLIMICSAYLLLQHSNPENGEQTETQETTPSVETLPNTNIEVTIPKEDIDNQISEIDKSGFDSQTLYWIEKLEGVCDLAAELNSGKTLEGLCNEYFYDEYQKYQESFLLGNDQLEEYPQEQVDALYDDLISLAEAHAFGRIVARVGSLMKQYKFTMPYNYKIGDIYKDALTLERLDEMSDEMRIKNISNLKTPELMLIAAIQDGYREQCTMYAASSSLCFPKNTHINIQSVEHYCIPYSTDDYHEKMMNTYFNTMATDLPVTKITFVIDFEKSNFQVFDFGKYFKKNVLITEAETEAICIYDDNGVLLHDLGVLSKKELEDLKLEKPEYAIEIDLELKRRDSLGQNNKTESDILPEQIDGDFVGMFSPDEGYNTEEYDFDKYEKFKSTVFEVYIPEYKLAKTYNRIYAIFQTTNTEIVGLGSLSYYMSTYRSNHQFLVFVNNNQWSRNLPNYNIADQITGDGTPD